MRVNWDTQRISPCISLTFAFHMSPEEGLENTFRDNLQSHGVNLMKMRTTQHTFSSRDSQCQRHCHLCVPPPLSLHIIAMRCMWMLKWHLPIPMPTSTINPREIS